VVIGKTRRDSGMHDELNSSIFKAKIITVVGLAVAIFGVIGTLYYGSQTIREEANSTTNPPYTAASQIKNISPLELEAALVIIMMVGFGILSFGVVTSKFDKPLDFY
jgi:hypothetical protein